MTPNKKRKKRRSRVRRSRYELGQGEAQVLLVMIYQVKAWWEDGAA